MTHDGGQTVSRRNVLVAGGLAAGHLLLGHGPWPRGLRNRGGRRRGRRDGARSPFPIRMRSAHRGADVWFEPVGLRLRPGETVRWLVGRGVHTSTAYHPDNGDYPLRMPRDAAPWDSGFLAEDGEHYEHTFQREGVYDYFCRPHEAAGMVGRIVVAREERTDHRELPGWDGGAREAELSPRDGEESRGRRLPRGARTAFPSVSRVLEEGSVAATRVGREAG